MARGVTEPARFIDLGAESLDDLVPAERFLQDLIDLGRVVLSAAAGAADTAA